MDPLSDVLSLLKLRTYAAAGLDAGGSWSLQYPKYEGIKCYALLSGQCWLSVDACRCSYDFLVARKHSHIEWRR